MLKTIIHKWKYRFDDDYRWEEKYYQLLKDYGNLERKYNNLVLNIKADCL